MFIELCLAGCSDHFPRETVPVLKNPLDEKLFPDIELKPPLTQINVTSLNPANSYEIEDQ